MGFLSSIGSIGGTLLGGYFGGSTGAKIGGMLGGAAGSAIDGGSSSKGSSSGGTTRASAPATPTVNPAQKLYSDSSEGKYMPKGAPTSGSTNASKQRASTDVAAIYGSSSPIAMYWAAMYRKSRQDAKDSMRTS